MSTLTVLDLLKDLKDAHDVSSRKQDEILERLSKLEDASAKQDRRQLKLEDVQASFKDELSSLITETDKVKDDLAKKFEAVNLALHQPAGMRLIRVTELLELILHYLPMKDLLLAQRVSLRFKEVIDTSVQLQRQLFFVPAPIDGVNMDEIIMNPLLSFETHPRSMHVIHSNKTLRTYYFGIQGVYDTDDVTDEDEGLVPGVLARIVVTAVTSSGQLFAERPDTMCYNAGSWQRMYFTQPPCALIESLHQSDITRHLERKAMTIRHVWTEDNFCDYDPATAEQYAQHGHFVAEQRSK